jgi:hypothetical protein
MSRPWVRPAVFGALDGLTVVLGVLLSLAHRPELVLTAAVGVAAAEGGGMAGGEYLSASGPRPARVRSAAVIGAATMGASLLPALPYGLFPARVAVWCSVGAFVGVGAGIALLRAPGAGRRRAWGETFGVLAAVVGFVALCELITPGGTA